MLSLLNATQPDRLRNRVRIERGPAAAVSPAASPVIDFRERMRQAS